MFYQRNCKREKDFFLQKKSFSFVFIYLICYLCIYFNKSILIDNV
ncbi:hypothetical protein HMPREF3226_00570 [Prevotella corporis]|uniref:Uncharacterized protein n=1 Tax=Prevotella corporis TaxID=28128 RepID=A0A133QJH9_9BACT|nr:hypothetical protein HMPREF3226_00570 [Prevotella corporis]